jgi:Fe-S cluster biogenesis protein NfuA
MFIQTESTPNPATMKFLPGQDVMGEGTADFKDADAAKASPLADRLFALGDIEGVFFGSDFVTVTKADAVEWMHIRPAVLGAIMDHFTSGAPLMADGADTKSGHAAAKDDDSPLVTQIKDILDTRVRPAVAQDGGDIVFHGFEEGVVYLNMIGACAGCPASTATLKNGVENLLKHFVPEVQEVRAV